MLSRLVFLGLVLSPLVSAGAVSPFLEKNCVECHDADAKKGGLDLTSADGRAGIHTLLSEIERACPGVLLQQAARMELRAIGWPRSSSEAPRAGR